MQRPYYWIGSGRFSFNAVSRVLVDRGMQRDIQGPSFVRLAPPLESQFRSWRNVAAIKIEFVQSRCRYHLCPEIETVQAIVQLFYHGGGPAAMRRRSEEKCSRSRAADGMIDPRGKPKIILACNLWTEAFIVKHNTERMEANYSQDILRGVNFVVEQIYP